MPMPLRLAAGIAVIALVGVAAINLLGRTPDIGSTPSPTPFGSPSPGEATPTPAASPTERPTPAPTVDLPGEAFHGGALAAGTYHSTTFTRPPVVLTVPDGWSRWIEDTEVLGLKRGEDIMAFTHQATTISDDAIKGVLCDYSTRNGTPKETAEPFTNGTVSGFYGDGKGCGTLFYDAASSAYDPSGEIVAAWVVELYGEPLVGIYDGSVATLPDVQAFMTTIGLAP